MEKILVIKVNEYFEYPEPLRERARKAWRINAHRLDDVNHVIVLHHFKVIGEYSLGFNTIGEVGKYHFLTNPEHDIDINRVCLILKCYPEEELFMGKYIYYKTSNPITIKSYEYLKTLIEK